MYNIRNIFYQLFWNLKFLFITEIMSWHKIFAYVRAVFLPPVLWEKNSLRVCKLSIWVFFKTSHQYFKTNGWTTCLGQFKSILQWKIFLKKWKYIFKDRKKSSGEQQIIIIIIILSFRLYLVDITIVCSFQRKEF